MTAFTPTARFLQQEVLFVITSFLISFSAPRSTVIESYSLGVLPRVWAKFVLLPSVRLDHTCGGGYSELPVTVLLAAKFVPLASNTSSSARLIIRFLSSRLPSVVPSS